MGTPVTSLSLSVTQDLLATSHINKRGVFLWSNQLMFGDPSAVATYTEQPVPVHLPSIAAAADGEGEQQQQHKGSRQQQQQQQKRQMKQHQGGDDMSEGESESDEDESSDEGDKQQQQQQQLLAGREVRLMIDGGVGSDSSDDFFDRSGIDSSSSSSSSSDEGDDADGSSGSGSDSDTAAAAAAAEQQQLRSSRKKRRRAQRAAAEAAKAAEAAAVASAAYRRVDEMGAPAPLAPHLATLSLLPRSQVGGCGQILFEIFFASRQGGEGARANPCWSWSGTMQPAVGLVAVLVDDVAVQTGQSEGGLVITAIRADQVVRQSRVLLLLLMLLLMLLLYVLLLSAAVSVGEPVAPRHHQGPQQAPAAP